VRIQSKVFIGLLFLAVLGSGLLFFGVLKHRDSEARLFFVQLTGISIPRPSQLLQFSDTHAQSGLVAMAGPGGADGLLVISFKLVDSVQDDLLSTSVWSSEWVKGRFPSKLIPIQQFKTISESLPIGQDTYWVLDSTNKELMLGVDAAHGKVLFFDDKSAVLTLLVWDD